MINIAQFAKIIMVVANAPFSARRHRAPAFVGSSPSLASLPMTELFADDGITRANQNRPVQGLRLKGLARREFADALSRRASARAPLPRSPNDSCRVARRSALPDVSGPAS